MKRKIIVNIIELILWSIMLFICYCYVTLNSAEKTNFISGLDVLKHKVEILFGNVIGKWDSSQAQAQQSMIRNYREILLFAKEKACTISVSIPQVETFVREISELSPIEYMKKEIYYSTQAAKLFNELEKCSSTEK